MLEGVLNGVVVVRCLEKTSFLDGPLGKLELPSVNCSLRLMPAIDSGISMVALETGAGFEVLGRLCKAVLMVVLEAEALAKLSFGVSLPQSPFSFAAGFLDCLRFETWTIGEGRYGC